jgi:hypothetical protein
MEAKAAPWRAMWCPTGPDVEGRKASLLAQVRDAIADLNESDDLAPITVEDVDRGLRSLKPTTGVGMEGCGPREWLRLPYVARAELAAILNMVERRAAWPWVAGSRVVDPLGRAAGQAEGPRARLHLHAGAAPQPHTETVR